MMTDSLEGRKISTTKPIYFSEAAGMSGFPFCDLEPAHMEKVISKLDWKNFFRIQQTCKDMEEFVRSSKNLKVQLGGLTYLNWNKEVNGSRQLWAQRRWISPFEMSAESLRGAQLRELVPLVSISDGFDEFLELLKEYRITCHHLLLNDDELTKDHCAELLKILKPVEIKINSEGSDRFEALFSSKYLKKSDVILNSTADVLTVFDKLVPILEEVKITCDLDDEEEDDVDEAKERVKLINSILQKLYSSPPPSLRSFELYTEGYYNLCKDIYRSHLVVENLGRSSDYCMRESYEIHFPNGTSCTVRVKDDYTDIVYFPKMDAWISVHSFDFGDIMRKSLPVAQRLNIKERRGAQNGLKLVDMAIKSFQSTAHSHLRHFRLKLYFRILPSDEQLLIRFRDFEPTIGERHEKWMNCNLSVFSDFHFELQIHADDKINFC